MIDDPELLLATPLGLPGSGRIRYGAAMALYRMGRMSEAELEVWRIASAHDGEDARRLLAERGLPVAPRARQPQDAVGALRLLVAEALRYLDGLSGPGVAEVRLGLAQAASAAPPRPADLPVIARHLPAALDALTADDPALARAIAMAAPHLGWTAYDLYPAEQIGAEFAQGHAYAQIAGSAAQDFEFGLFLIAPDLLYRDHCHPAPELYVPLTGPHGWRFGPDRPLIVKPAHEPVWNDPLRPHLTKVGPLPFLAFYGWTRDVNEPARVIPAADWAELEALRL